ncbi:phosphatidate cytidylyltransferase [Paenibacillus fonticola]|uniref:phosphatidate cytidylyltransferase n=1 Tax=Paenibacillus fonticola TaxID=379896 RepID=UPI00036839C3|nr:phosphatidate cytidylyltransferase [Paenibacillus fonticola]
MKIRLITGLVAGVFFLGVCLIGGIGYQGLLMAMALVGYYEFVRMTKMPAFGGPAMLGYICILYMMFPWSLLNWSMPLETMPALWLMMFLFLAVTVFTKNDFPVGQASLLFLGTMYIGIGFSSIATTRFTPDGHGVFWTFLMLAAIWSSDAGAYFTGRRFGNKKLWPAISPNKTVEGALGGIALAVVAAVLFALFSDGLLSLGRAILLGASAAVVGQLGDLIQSAYKRVYGIKDSGKLLPGHGGILDRCDSWVVVFPFVHILMLLPYY